MALKHSERTIAAGGIVLGLTLTIIGRIFRNADLIIGLAFLAFFAWLGLAIWLRPLLAKRKSSQHLSAIHDQDSNPNIACLERDKSTDDTETQDQNPQPSDPCSLPPAPKR